MGRCVCDVVTIPVAHDPHDMLVAEMLVADMLVAVLLVPTHARAHAHGWVTYRRMHTAAVGREGGKAGARACLQGANALPAAGCLQPNPTAEMASCVAASPINKGTGRWWW